MSTTDSTNPQAGNSTEQTAEDMETVRKVYVRDLHPKQQVHTVFRVTKKAKQSARSGKSFLAVGLEDKTGEVDARVFEQIDAFDAAFNTGDYVLIRAEVIVFHGKNQLVISRLEKLDPEPIDPAEFTAPPKTEKSEKAEAPKAPREERPPREEKEERAGGPNAIAQVRQIADRIHDANVKAIVTAFLDDPELKLQHAHRGGVGETLLSALKHAQRLSEQNSSADRDLVLAGTILRNICRVREAQREHVDEARLVGAVVMAAQRLREKTSKVENFPPLLELHLTHLIVASESGPLPRPATLEAILVNAVQTLELGAAAFVEAVRRDSSSNASWTDSARAFDRNLWKGPSPTGRGRGPIVEKRPRRERPEKGPRPEAKEAAPKLAFKPLAELAPEATPPSEAAPTESGNAPPNAAENSPSGDSQNLSS